METRIGEAFREARRRRQVELAEAERATRIRPRYLRAIEAEEWDALPGGVYTRGFIRAYASFLGLDGDRLAEDYRESVEGASREWPQLPEGTALARQRRGVPAAGWLAVLAVLGLAAVVIVFLPGDGGGERESGPVRNVTPQGGPAVDAARRERPVPVAGTSVRLIANGEVWVCLLDGGKETLVDGEILAAGTEAGPFHSDSFTVSFGNGDVSMLIDGKEAPIPPTSSPVGYSIDPSGKLTELAEAERPTCV